MFLSHPSIFLWDIAILLFLALSSSIALLSLVWVRHSSKKPRWMRGIVGFLSILSILSFLLTGYASFLEPRLLVTRRQEVSFPVQQRLKIAVMSDIHVGPYKGEAFLRRAVERINSELPDIVLLAGGYLYDNTSRLEELEALRNLHPVLGVYAILGRSDAERSAELAALFEMLGITLLRNERRVLDLQEGAFVLEGTDDPGDLASAFRGTPENLPILLLARTPDIILDAKSRNASLVVTGSSHGTPIRLPFLGPLIPGSLGRGYDYGIFSDQRTTLAITRGIGETGIRARLFSWPEILILETKAPE